MKILGFTTFIFSLLIVVYSQRIVFPGKSSSDCRTSKGLKGVCKTFSECPIVRSTPATEDRPVICRFNGRIPIICCPRSEKLIQNSTSEVIPPPKVNWECGKRGSVLIEENDNYIFSSSSNIIETSLNYNIETPLNLSVTDVLIYHPSVVGGIISSRNSWPWMALLGRERKGEKEFFCSAVLINPNFVITAAHCVLAIEQFFVRFGEHDYNPEEGFTLSKNIEDVPVESVIFHPKYTPDAGYHDAALLKLQRKIEFRDEVSPICLPWGEAINEKLIEEEVTIAGWGTENYGGVLSSVLREVNLTVFDVPRCKKSYSTLTTFRDSFPDGLTKQNIVCAGDVDGKKDACQGDSGGPMMHRSEQTNIYSLAGIISKGFGCGLREFPGLYAPIRNLDTLNWIKRTAF